jgi:hypothetical protein
MHPSDVRGSLMSEQVREVVIEAAILIVGMALVALLALALIR